MNYIKTFMKIAASAEKTAGKMYKSNAAKAEKKNMPQYAKLLNILSESEMTHAGMIKKCLDNTKENG